MGVETIADSPDRFKIDRLFGVVFEDFSNLQNEIVDSPAGGKTLIAPYSVEKLVAADCLWGLFNEIFDYHAFFAAKLKISARPRSRMS